MLPEIIIVRLAKICCKIILVKLITNYDELFKKLSLIVSTFIRFLLYLLLLIVCLALVIGIAKAGIDLYRSLTEPLERILQQILLDTVFIIALVEIAITVLGYLKDGQVHVRYIVDTILIIMLNEVVTLFFKGADLSELIGVSIVVATLAAIRISVTRLAPKSGDL